MNTIDEDKECHDVIYFYRGADKFLARPGKKQATATKL